MSEPSVAHAALVSIAAARRLDQVCDRFEAAWKAAGSPNERPRIEDYVHAAPEPERLALLRELLALEIEQRYRVGETLEPDEYRARFPALEGEWLGAALRAKPAAVIVPSGPVAAGQIVSHYCIEERLGSGGMGVVYKARDIRLDRRVALKFLPPEYAQNPRALERFQREARTASALNHPHICTIYDIDVYENQPFFVMEFIQGHTLRVLARQPIGLQTLFQIGEQTAKALAVAHAAGIVHRDIKPENLMVREDGYVKVVDFGLARALPSSLVRATAALSDVTDPGTLLGTLRYMSPEQGRAQAASGASDIFSLGIILYELATGHHPFEADSPIVVLHAILDQAPVRPSQWNPEISAPLEALLERMLAKEARLRPSAAEVQTLLSELAQTKLTRPAATPLPVQRHIVGRQQEREQLYAGFESAASGHGLFLCVAGEPGLGKTTLVEDFLRDLAAPERGATIARGRCSERLAGSEAYLPILEALDSLLHSAVADQVVRVLKVTAPTWYVQLAPLVSEDSSFERVLANAKTASQERLKREFYAFLQELSRLQPLVVFIDDIHWADVSTVDLLAYIGRRCEPLRLLLVLTYRPTDMLLSKHPFVPVKLDLQARGICREVPLGFLCRADIDGYLSLAFPGHAFAEKFAAFVHARTEGNPLFMVDLLRYLRERGMIVSEPGGWVLTQSFHEIQKELPESVRSMIQRKIDRLSVADRRLLIAASVQGQEFDAAVVAKALKRDAAGVEERLERLECVHAFVQRVAEKELPDRTLTVHYRFVHVLYQNALYALLAPTRKAALSAAVAEALLGCYLEQSAQVASELAILFETARDFARASDYCLVASQNAARVYANEEAVALARRARANAEKLPAESRHAQVLAATFHLGPLYQTHAQFQEALANYQVAEKAACEAADAEARIKATYGMATALLYLGRLQEAREQGERALELARTASSVVGVACAEEILSEVLLRVGDLNGAVGYMDRALPVLKDKGPLHLAVAGTSLRGSIHYWQLENADAEGTLGWGLENARRLGSGFWTVFGLFKLGSTFGNQGRLSEALDTLREGMRLAELNDERHWLPRLPNTLAWVHREFQDLETALRLDREGTQLAKEMAAGEAEAHSRINLGHDYLVLGEMDRAFEQLQQVLQIPDTDD